MKSTSILLPRFWNDMVRGSTPLVMMNKLKPFVVYPQGVSRGCKGRSSQQHTHSLSNHMRQSIGEAVWREKEKLALDYLKETLPVIPTELTSDAWLGGEVMGLDAKTVTCPQLFRG